MSKASDGGLGEVGHQVGSKAAGRPRAATALGLVVALLAGTALGWLVADLGEDRPYAPGQTEFDATVDSLDPDGTRGCVSPLDPTLLDRFGGPVCGRLFVSPGTQVAPARRVHVEWFSVVTREDGESIEALLLSRPG